MKIFLITDLHLNHESIYKYRPHDYLEQVFRDWKRRVQKDDIVINLGDVILARKSELKGIMNSLSGRKILTRGNHDDQSLKWYMKNGFDFACDSFLMDDLLFSHEPQDLSSYGDSVVNIHGHFHETTHRSASDYPFYSDRHRLLSLELHGYWLQEIYVPFLFSKK